MMPTFGSSYSQRNYILNATIGDRKEKKRARESNTVVLGQKYRVDVY